MHRTVIKAEEIENLMQKDVRFLRLWDLYGGLLTDTQREITNLYFNCDLSPAEIAEAKGVSRQSVSDCLHKCKRLLEDAEEKLHFSKALDEVSLAYSLYMTRVNRWAAEQKEKHPAWAAELDELLALTGGEEELVQIVQIEE